jgi:Holliday junction resolvase-like predicted endonuclease
MATEREVLISFLRLTKGGPVEIKDLSSESQIPRQLVHETLTSLRLGIVEADGHSISGGPEQRLRAAHKAVELGADIERVCGFLTWSEFEDISVMAFEANDFKVKKHFRFSGSGRRWEIDILAAKRPIVACADCKQWHRGWRGSASRKATEQQIERTRVLAETAPAMLEKIDMKGWKHADFLPMVLSLTPSAHKFHRGAPIVPVLQLRDFLHDLPAYVGKIKRFRASFPDA